MSKGFPVNDARYFKHDSNARRDPKIKSLLRAYGIEGYGRFWILLELLRESSGYRIEDKQYVFDALAEDFRCTPEEASRFVNDCSSKFLLLEKDNGYFYSHSFLKRMYSLDEIRQKRSEIAKNHWNNE